MNELREAALKYAQEFGWRILPVDGKKPLIKSWPEAATTNPEEIKAWWHEWPEANVGVLTGEGLFVIDVDGKEGEASLGLLGPLPPTLECRTARGRHLYFLGDGPNTTGKLGPGLDTRGKGGFVVAPPSVHKETGVIYRWVEDA